MTTELKLVSNNQFTPKHLKKWSMPSSYFGASWEDYYVFLGQNRDSDVLTRSNFECGLEAIGGTSKTVVQVHEGHWAVGWVEWIAIHQDDTKALVEADKIAEALEDYCIVDESHFSEMEQDENFETLENHLKYFMSDICDELELDQDNLSKNAIKTLEQFIEAAFFYEASYSGEAWFCIQRVKKHFNRISEDSNYYRTMKGASKKMIKLLDSKFGA